MDVGRASRRWCAGRPATGRQRRPNLNLPSAVWVSADLRRGGIIAGDSLSQELTVRRSLNKYPPAIDDQDLTGDEPAAAAAQKSHHGRDIPG